MKPSQLKLAQSLTEVRALLRLAQHGSRHDEHTGDGGDVDVAIDVALRLLDQVSAKVDIIVDADEVASRSTEKSHAAQ